MINKDAVKKLLGYWIFDDMEGGIQYNCKNTIIDVDELSEIIHELEAFK